MIVETGRPIRSVTVPKALKTDRRTRLAKAVSVGWVG